MFKNLDIFIKYIVFLALVIVVLGALGIISYKQPKIVSSDNNITKNIPAPEPTNQYRLGLTMTGSEDQLFDLRQGIAEFEITYNGDDDFSASILKTDGTLLSQLANRKGPFKEKKDLLVPETDVYILSVKCQGEWSIMRK